MPCPCLVPSFACPFQRWFFDLEQLDFEDQGAVCQRAAFAVGQVLRDEQLGLAAFLHQLQPLGPALDHAVDPESGRFVLLVGTVKWLAVDQWCRGNAP